MDFFTGVGFRCPPRKGIPDFLQEVSGCLAAFAAGLPALACHPACPGVQQVAEAVCTAEEICLACLLACRGLTA